MCPQVKLTAHNDSVADYSQISTEENMWPIVKPIIHGCNMAVAI